MIRLCAAKHWKSDRDQHQAISLLEILIDELDWEYLRKRAQEELVDDLLNDLLNQRKTILHE